MDTSQHKIIDRPIESKEVVLLENQTEIIEDGLVVGNSFKTITRTIKNETIYLDVNIVERYDDGRIIKNTEITTIQLVNDHVAIINGETVILSQEEYRFEESMTASYTVLDSGGRHSYTTWEERFDSNIPPSPYLTVMTSASGIKNRVTNSEAMFLEFHGAKDDAISRTIFTPTSSINQLKIINFKSYASTVVQARTTINYNAALLLAALGVTVLTSASVIGAIGGSIAVAGFAVAIWDAGSTADNAMSSAYAILNTL